MRRVGCKSAKVESKSIKNTKLMLQNINTTYWLILTFDLFFILCKMLQFKLNHK